MLLAGPPVQQHQNSCNCIRQGQEKQLEVTSGKGMLVPLPRVVHLKAQWFYLDLQPLFNRCRIKETHVGLQGSGGGGVGSGSGLCCCPCRLLRQSAYRSTLPSPSFAPSMPCPHLEYTSPLLCREVTINNSCSCTSQTTLGCSRQVRILKSTGLYLAF